jgi:hypothetical protein
MVGVAELRGMWVRAFVTGVVLGLGLVLAGCVAALVVSR